MGTTEVSRLPYPELTDIPDVPADMKELADAIEVMGSTLSANLLGRLKLPKVYQAWRDRDDAVSSSVWGTAVGLFEPNVPKGTLLVFSTFIWRCGAGYSWFETKVSGTRIYGSVVDSGPGDKQSITTLVGTIPHPGGDLNIASSFGFSVQDCWILHGSNLFATIFPDAPTA